LRTRRRDCHQEHRVARSGPASVETTEGDGAHEVEGALEVPYDALCACEMGLTRVVQVEAHVLDRICNVGLGECEVLESPSQTAVGSRVTDGAPYQRRHWSECRVT
jgi:hypothetical protein